MLDETNRLCMECGLCCDGSFFVYVPIGDEETIENLTLCTQKTELAVTQPCTAHQDGACAIYHSGRPRACDEFQCRLLRQLKRGKLDYSTARAEIARIKQLKGKFTAEIAKHCDVAPGDGLAAIYQRFIEQSGIPSDSVAFRQRYSALLLLKASFDYLKQKNFTPNKSKPPTKDSAVPKSATRE